MIAEGDLLRIMNALDRIADAEEERNKLLREHQQEQVEAWAKAQEREEERWRQMVSWTPDQSPQDPPAHPDDDRMRDEVRG